LKEENSEDNTVLVITLLTSVVLEKSLLLNWTEIPTGNITKYRKMKSGTTSMLRFENRFDFQYPEYIKSEIRKEFNKNRAI
jgi:hypothetical protein